MEILVVGTLAIDSVQTPFGLQEEILGGSASYFATAASYFSQVGIVGVIGHDFPQEHLTFFKSRNIDTTGICTLDGKTFRWSGRYDDNLNIAHTLETQLNVLAQFRPELPPNYRDAEYILLGNIDPALQLMVLEQINNPRLVVCDSMNYWIQNPQYRKQLEQVLPHVNVLCINDAETRLLANEYNLVKAAKIIRNMGPRTLIVKRGEYGALLFDQDNIFAAPAFPLEEVRDPTGAGDSFAGGMIGFLAKNQEINANILRQAVAMGSVIASFAVEDFSLERFKRLNLDEINKRFADYKKLTVF
ncbi:MAG: sugar kinase [Deltaproteobacteria bacterium]|nr:sugar kinase [Deltaproteobacteria bacterium]